MFIRLADVGEEAFVDGSISGIYSGRIKNTADYFALYLDNEFLIGYFFETIC